MTLFFVESKRLTRSQSQQKRTQFFLYCISMISFHIFNCWRFGNLFSPNRSGSCIWKLLKYISSFCWFSQSHRYCMTGQQPYQSSYNISLCPKDWGGKNTTQHDTINMRERKNARKTTGQKNGKIILINFIKLFMAPMRNTPIGDDDFFFFLFIIVFEIVLLFHIWPMWTLTS